MKKITRRLFLRHTAAAGAATVAAPAVAEAVQETSKERIERLVAELREAVGSHFDDGIRGSWAVTLTGGRGTAMSLVFRNSNDSKERLGFTTDYVVQDHNPGAA